MFIQYKFLDYTPLQTLGTSTYAASVLADFVGLLTGSITTTAGLSAYADKPNCVITGSQFPWTVYDSNAHPGYSGAAKVLRRLNTDGVTYSYLFIAFYFNSPALNVYLGSCGGWDATNHLPLTTLVDQYHGETALLPPNTAPSVANMPMTDTLTYQTFRSITTNNSNYPTGMTFNILNSSALLAMWESAGGYTTSTGAPGFIIAEHDGTHPFSNAAAGCAPIVYFTPILSGNNTHAPAIKLPFGNIVEPSYVQLSSVFSCPASSAIIAGNPYDPSINIPDYTRDSSGNVAIPVVPIDVQLKAISQPYACYAGRLKELFATLKTAGNPGDTFTIGSNTWVIIPASAYNGTSASYSTQGKFCAMVK